MSGHDEMLMVCERSWHRAWNDLKARPDTKLFGELVECYRQPHRYYHCLQHLAECLERFESSRSLCTRPAEVELALWFHDAIYDPKRSDNEAKSALWASQSLLQAGLSESVARRVEELVLATGHSQAPVEPDKMLLVDIDLSIFAADQVRFDQYEDQVRREYAWVPGPLYRRERRKVLKRFLDRPSIFMTNEFRDRFEQVARENLTRSLGRL